MVAFVHLHAVGDEEEEVYQKAVRMSFRRAAILVVIDLTDDPKAATGQAAVVLSFDPMRFFAVEETYDDVMGMML